MGGPAQKTNTATDDGESDAANFRKKLKPVLDDLDGTAERQAMIDNMSEHDKAVQAEAQKLAGGDINALANPIKSIGLYAKAKANVDAPPTMPDITDSLVRKAGDSEIARQRRMQGRSSTFLTGPGGVLANKSLLGG